MTIVVGVTDQIFDNGGPSQQSVIPSKLSCLAVWADSDPFCGAKTKIGMENGLRRLFVFITLTLFIITVISVVSYGSKGISTEQDEHTEKGCLSTLQKMATALDFTSVKEYEHHLLSSGQRLPCGLQARNKGAHKNNKVLAHVKQTSLWSFIFGNLFQDNSNQHVETKKSSVAWTSQKSPHTDLQKRIHLESPKGSLKLTSNLTNLSHAGFQGLNETKNDLFGKSSVNHDRQFSRKVQNSRSLSGKGFNRDDGPIRRANVSESAHMAIKQSSLPDYVIESPKVTRSSSNPRFVREANHQKTVHIQSKINPRDGDTARDAWIAKLRQEAYRLGYALIKHHGPVVNRSPKAKISQHEVNNQRDDRQDLQMDVRNKFVNAAVLSDVKLYKHPKISGSEWSNSSHQNNASKPVIRQQGLSLPVQIPTNVEENAFESKDSVRLQAEARIEKEMHARLRAEARSSIQHFHHDDELKAYQVRILGRMVSFGARFFCLLIRISPGPNCCDECN